MPVYRVPPPARAGPASAGSLSAEFWALGLAASCQMWPPSEYAFRLPVCGLPLYIGHEEERLVTSGSAPADVGACRYFAEVADLGLVCLIEIGSDHPSVLWDLAEGKRCGLSIGYALDPPPDGGPEWIVIREVSLTERPGDPLARVVSTGDLALADWLTLTGEAVPLPDRHAQA